MCQPTANFPSECAHSGQLISEIGWCPPAYLADWIFFGKVGLDSFAIARIFGQLSCWHKGGEDVCFQLGFILFLQTAGKAVVFQTYGQSAMAEQ